MEKTSGIYRIYIKTNYLSKTNEEYSYIGVSKNIEQRWKSHIRNINKFLNNEKQVYGIDEWNFSYWLKTYKVPAKESNTFKIAMFLLINNLTIENLKKEIIEECKWNKIDEIEDKEIFYIENYNSEWKGFNGVFAKAFKYISPFSTINLNGEELEKRKEEMNRRLKLENQRQLKRIEYSVKNNIQPMPWIFENYRRIPNYLIDKEDIKKYFEDGWMDWLVACNIAIKMIDDKSEYIDE